MSSLASIRGPNPGADVQPGQHQRTKSRGRCPAWPASEDQIPRDAWLPPTATLLLVLLLTPCHWVLPLCGGYNAALLPITSCDWREFFFPRKVCEWAHVLKVRIFTINNISLSKR